MARAIIGNPCLVILNDSELEEYGKQFERFSRFATPWTTFERFCLSKAIDDEKVLEIRRYQESIWHREVKREHQARAKHE